MISIVLPVYNGERFLELAIKSILSQSYADFELIIVNDCSTDNSLTIAEEYERKDKRVKIINNLTNQRLPKSLNIGFEQCKGEYFTWTSDDNILLPNALEKLLSTLESTNADLVFSRCETINPEGKILDKTEIYEDLNEIYYNNIILASFLYRREVHEELGGYDVDKFLIEDYDFWLRAYRKFKFVFVPETLYQIRFHGNNLGAKNVEGVKSQKIQLLKDNMNYVNDDNVLDKINMEISNCYFEIANTYYSKLKINNNKRKIKIYRIKDLIRKIIKL